MIYGYYYVPFHPGSRYALRWQEWYSSGGKEGEEPPAPVKKQLALYDKVRETVNPDERSQLFGEVLTIAKEQFYAIGTVQLEEGYGIKPEDFHNVPSWMPDSYEYPNPGPTRPEQYFVEG